MITVERLFYRYPRNTVDTLKDVSFTVGKGEVFGLLGPSGAGKSTLQKILTGTLSGFQGEVTIQGSPLTPNNSGFHERIGVDFEFPNFYGKFTARENLRHFSSLYAKPALDADPLLERMGLLVDADKRVNDFSKGMKTRLGFIRCLLHDPEILFLDEPTSGLDPANARILKDMVKELQEQGKTILLTTHIMHDAEELCDRVAFIVDGEIRALDTPSSFCALQNKQEVRYSLKNNDGSIQECSIPLSSLGSDTDFLQAAQAQRITRIHSKETGLEDVFISLTGRKLT